MSEEDFRNTVLEIPDEQMVLTYCACPEGRGDHADAFQLVEATIKSAQTEDVGGGEGALLADILSRARRACAVSSSIYLKRSPTLQKSWEAIIGARCQIIGGNFFDSVPKGADAYLLKGIIHDWPDEDAINILRNTRKAIRPGGTLLLVESLVGSTATRVGLIDLLMLVIGGRERTEAEFRSLLAAAGFALTRIIPTEVSSLIECHPL
jgi:hypothetical protein